MVHREPSKPLKFDAYGMIIKENQEPKVVEKLTKKQKAAKLKELANHNQEKTEVKTLPK